MGVASRWEVRMRSSSLIVVGLSALVGACATPAAKTACFPLTSWSAPVFRCAAAPAPVAIVTPPPPPPPEPKVEPKPEPEPPPAPPPPPPPRAEMKTERIELSETVQFETGSDVLVDRSKSLLDEVANELSSHPEVTKISIEGHTDSMSGNKFNMKLSQRRVAS